MEVGIWEVVFIILVITFSGINNYLLNISLHRSLPSPVGYNLFAKAGHLLVLVLSIWNLGWLFGIIFFALYFFNIINASISWIFAYIFIIGNKESNNCQDVIMTVYGFFPILVFVLLAICIVSLFVVPFQSFRERIDYYNYQPVLYFSIVSAVGALIRILIMKNVKDVDQ